eukprot:scaffold3524_cov100-Skeletonema_dohrnii-CCMP3373.AAC.4
MVGTNNNDNSWQQPGRSMAGSAEPEHEITAMKKHGHVAQSRSIQKSHALPRRSSSRPKSRPKSSGKSRSSSRGRMDSPPGSAVSDEANNKGSLKRSGSQNRFSSWSIIREGKIDERGRCRRHPNIELYRREATNSNESWRMLLQDCPLCSLHDSGLNCNNDYSEMMRKDSITMSGEATAQTSGTATTSPSSGEETSIGSDTSNNNDNMNKREKIGPSSTSKQKQIPPPPRKQSSVQTLKALGKMHMDADDAASVSARSISSRRSRQPPPPPPVGRNTFSNPNPSSPSKKGSNASIRSLSTKELSRLRKERHSSEGNNERIAELRAQQNSERDESAHNDLGRSLERIRAERKAAKDSLKERRKSGRSHNQKERFEESSQTFTLPLNDVRRGRATGARDDDILGAAAEIRARARRSLSRSKGREKAAEDMFGTRSVSGDDHTVDGDAVSVSSRGRRSITNPHGLAESPRPLPVQRRSQSRERRSRSGGRTVDGSEVERQRYNSMNERSSEVLINRRREMRQRLAERQNAADYRRGGSASQAGDIDYQAVKDEVVDDWNRDTRRSARSAERSERGRGRSRSRVRDGISKIRSASLKAFRKKDEKKIDSEEQTVDSGRMSFRSLVSHGSRLRTRTLDIEEQTVDSGRMSFRSLVSQGSRIRSRSRGRRVKSQGDLDIHGLGDGIHDHVKRTAGRSEAFEV